MLLLLREVLCRLEADSAAGIGLEPRLAGELGTNDDVLYRRPVSLP